MIKKLSAFMATVMLFACCCFTTASAVENKLTLSVNAPKTVKPGDQLTVSVDFSDNTGFNTLGVRLTYPEGFTYAENSERVSDIISERFYLDFAGYQGETYVFSHNAQTRTITFVGASLYDITDATGSVFSVNFTAPATACDDNIFAVEIIDEAYNEVGQIITVTKNDGSMDVIQYMLGDVNQDGYVRTDDAMLTLYAAIKKITLTETQALAANVITSDGVNTADAIRILYYAIKKISSF